MHKREMRASDVTRVLRAFDAAGIRAGVTGGWGIDALLRRQTRPHSDLDLGISADDVAATIDLSAALGYAIADDQRPSRLVLRSNEGQIDVHPITWDASGAGVQTGFVGQVFQYPPGSLEAEGEIEGHRVACGTPELQLAFHLGYKPTERDRRDMTALARVFDLALPASLST